MTVLAIVSAKGSPGVSTAAQAMAMTWPRQVAIADLDPAGGDLIWRNRTPEGAPLDGDRGLLSLGASARRGADETTLTEHLQPTYFGPKLLAGISTPEQLSGLGAAWAHLPTIFARHEHDVLLDCGRVVPGSSMLPAVMRADVVLFVANPDLEGTANLRSRLRSFAESLGISHVRTNRVAVAVRGSYRSPRVAEEMEQLLGSEGLNVPVLGVLADDPKAAAVVAGRREGGIRRSLLGRSCATLGRELLAMAEAPSDISRPDRPGPQQGPSTSIRSGR